MAKPKTSGGGGGGETKKKVSYDHIVSEGFEFLTGAFAGQVLAGFAQTGFLGALKGLQGKLFDRLFSGKTKTDEAKSEDVAAAQKEYKKLLKASGADAALLKMGDDYIAALVAASNLPDDKRKEEIAKLQSEFRAKLNQHLLDKTRKGLPGVMAELAEIDEDLKSLKKFRRVPWVVPNRPKFYVADFMQWLQVDLDPQRRETVENRRSKITSARQIIDMLDAFGNPVERYNKLMFELGEPSFTEMVHEVVDAALSGNLEASPAIQKLAERSAENVRTRQQHGDMRQRSFRNRRNV